MTMAYPTPLPPLETQQKIVAELEQNLAAVAGAKRLKEKMEANIRAVIGRVWGEDTSSSPCKEHLRDEP